MILYLARLLPGTPLAALLAMDVATGIELIADAANMEHRAREAAERESRAAGGMPITSAPMGGLNGGRRTEVVRGGLNVLGGMMARQARKTGKALSL